MLILYQLLRTHSELQGRLEHGRICSSAGHALPFLTAQRPSLVQRAFFKQSRVSQYHILTLWGISTLVECGPEYRCHIQSHMHSRDPTCQPCSFESTHGSCK